MTRKDDKWFKLRKLAEKYYGNDVYGKHLPYQHELQTLIDENYISKDEIIKAMPEYLDTDHAESFNSGYNEAIDDIKEALGLEGEI